MVGEIEKGGYVYYHCTGCRGKCPEPCVREEVLEKEFTEMLKGIAFSPQVLAWAGEAMGEGHQDELKFHHDAIERLQRERQRVQDRMDAMYMDKLDGRIDNELFDRKASEFRAEQSRLMSDAEAHRNVSRGFDTRSDRLIALAHRAATLFQSQAPAEKRKLLDFVVSSCRRKGGELQPGYWRPFDLLPEVGSRRGHFIHPQIARRRVVRGMPTRNTCWIAPRRARVG